MARPPYQKHMDYYQLLDAIRAARGCFLCELARLDARQFFDDLLYEHVCDRSQRAELRAARGFCGPHARRLIEFGDGLGSSILYHEQLEMALDLLRREENAGGGLFSGSASGRWDKHAPCPVCRREADHCRGRLRTLVDCGEEGELRDAVEQSPGLCLPHLLNLLDLAGRDRELRRFYLELHRRKWSALGGELQEFIRKSDYRNQDEEFGPERDAWLRTIRLLVGRSGD